MNGINNLSAEEVTRKFTNVYDGEGEAAPQEATVFIAEDGSDHPVTPGA